MEKQILCRARRMILGWLDDPETTELPPAVFVGMLVFYRAWIRAEIRKIPSSWNTWNE